MWIWYQTSPIHSKFSNISLISLTKLDHSQQLQNDLSGYWLSYRCWHTIQASKIDYIKNFQLDELTHWRFEFYWWWCITSAMFVIPMETRHSCIKVYVHDISLTLGCIKHWAVRDYTTSCDSGAQMESKILIWIIAAIEETIKEALKA